MENYEYQPIKDTDEEHYKKSSSWAPFLRQLLICIGVWTLPFLTGLGLGSTTVVVAQMRQEANSEDAISIDMTSWLIVTGFLTSPIGAVIWALLAKHIGRKKPFLIICILMLLGFILMYFSTSVTHLIIGEALRGLGNSATLCVTMFILTESSSTKYRGFFLSMDIATSIWGIWVANTIGTFFHWTYIPVAAFVCLAVSFTAVFWPETPFWLASKGRFDECVAVHRRLKGTDVDSETELRKLIETQKECLRLRQCFDQSKISLKSNVLAFFASVSKKEFYKPLVLAMLAIFPSTFSGKSICSLYALEILTKVTNDKSSAHTVMLILDGVTIFSMYIGCVVARFVKRKKFVIITMTLAITCLLMLSLYFFLVNANVLKENIIAAVVLLVGFSVSVACGPNILCYAIYAELIPTDNRTTFTITALTITLVIHATYFKCIPLIIANASIYITFLIFAITASISTFLFWKFVPETKDKDLLEIQEHLKR